MMHHDKTVHAARGKWRGILMELGVPSQFLKNEHGPCPMCEGRDRFRFDDKEGSGSWICNQCGAGNGMSLAIKFTGQEFRDVAARIDAIVGNIKADAPRPKLDQGKIDRYLREVYLASQPVEPGDLAHRYLESRHIAERIYPDALRFAPKLADGDGGVRPCMIAMVGVHGVLRNGRQKYETIHRTFLRPDGRGKAEMASPRKVMPGKVPAGACVMLSSWPGYGPIGIAEGIETAMSASLMFDVPVWAAINATMMANWSPPEGADEVVIFADHDENFTGHRAAYTLANRLKTQPETKHLSVSVQIPGLPGMDWADEWMLRKSEAPA